MSRSALLVLTIGVAFVAAACTSAPPPTPSPAASAAASAAPTSAPVGARLAAVRARNSLICGVNGGLQGFSFLDQANNTWSGFDADFCRAVAAAVLGDANAVEFRA